VECNPTGDHKTLDERCVKADVHAYPTWMINGQKHEGMLSLERLAELSKFRYTAQAGATP
jgi:hypothetical protein